MSTITVLQDLRPKAERPFQVDEYFIEDHCDGTLSQRHGFETGSAHGESILEAVEVFLDYHAWVIANFCAEMGYHVQRA